MTKILVIILLVFGSGVLTAFSQERYQIVKDCGVPYELVVLSVKHLVGHTFLLAEEKYFNEKDLTLLFRCISKKNPTYSMLRVTLFSDRENLNVAIREHFYPPPDSNPPEDTSKTDCLNWRIAVRPCPYGYYRAVYYRIDDRELFDFSEDPNKPSMRGVILKKTRL